VQVDHVLIAGGLMQPIHILRQQQCQFSLLLKSGQSMVRRVGLRSAKSTPANQAARPIALTSGQFADKRLISHWRSALPVAFGVAVIGNARIRAATCAGKHKQALVTAHEISQRRMFRHCLNGTCWMQGHANEMGADVELQQD